MPPPFVRPGWEELNSSQRTYALNQYNIAAGRRGYKGIVFDDVRSLYPPGWSAANINPSLPSMGKLFKDQQNSFANGQGDSFDAQHYFTTTQAPFMDRNREGAGIDNFFGADPVPAPTGPYTTESQTESSLVTENQPEPASQGESPIIQEEEPMQTDEMAARPGTSHNNDQFNGIVGGETGPTEIPHNMHPGVAYSQTYKKTYKFQLPANAPVVKKVSQVVNTFAVDHKILVTNLRELPVNCLMAYLTSAEYATIASQRGVFAREVRVTVGKKSTQAAFETNASETSKAVLNYNKTYKVATGLNKHPFTVSRCISTYGAAAASGVPASIATPVKMHDLLLNAESDADDSIGPAYITRTAITLPNVFCQIIPYLYTNGFFDHSTLIKEYDDNNIPVVKYNYKFSYAPLTKSHDCEIVMYPSLDVATAINTGTFKKAYQDIRSTRSAKKRTIEGTTPNSITSVTDDNISTYYPLNLCTFSPTDVIEKSQFCHGDFESHGPYDTQPSLHIGVGEVPALNPFRTLANVASCFPTAFVPQMGEIWATFEIDIDFMKPSTHRIGKSAVPTEELHKAAMSRLKTFPAYDAIESVFMNKVVGV